MRQKDLRKKIDRIMDNNELFFCTSCNRYFSEKLFELHDCDYTPEGWVAGRTATEAASVGAASVDMVNHPPHYTAHPSGVECIQITEHMGFCIGNAIKYLWRADEKGSAIEDLEKAKWYVEREIEKRKREQNG